MTSTTPKQFSFKDIITAIRKKSFAPIYVLHGEESYYIDEIVNLLQDTVVEKDFQDFDMTVMYGADSTIESLSNSARRYPMFSKYQLVILKEAQSMRDIKNQFEKLESYSQHPVSTTVLVITYKNEAIKSSNKFLKSVIKSGGVVFESKQVKDWQIEPLIEQFCKSKGVGIDRKSVEMLKNFIGTDLKRLFGEIDKLIVACNQSAITPELIEKNIGISKDFNNFELIKALSLRQYAKAIQIVHYFKSNPKQNPTIVTAPVLFNFFSNLLLAYYSKDKTDRGLMQSLRFKSPIQLTDIKAAMPKYNARKCLNIIREIRKFDRLNKGIGSTQDEYALLKELIYKIFTS